MSRPDISCHPSVALDVEFEIWDVKPSRNTLLRVSYQCSIVPQYRYFKNMKRQSFNTVLLCLDCNKYHRSEPQDRSAGRADWRWNRHEFHWICLAELLTIWVHLKIGRTTISRFDGKHSSPSDLHNYSSVSSWDKMYRVKSVLRYLTLVPTIFRLNGK